MPARILIVDDHEVVREGVRTIISKAKRQWEICGEATNGREGIAAATALKPDVIVLDVSMPGMSGFEVASRLSGLDRPSKVLIFTMHESGRLAYDARKVGAQGYVLKSDAARDLVSAIEIILSGGTFFGGPEKHKTRKEEDDPNPGIMFRLALAFL